MPPRSWWFRVSRLTTLGLALGAAGAGSMALASGGGEGDAEASLGPGASTPEPWLIPPLRPARVVVPHVRPPGVVDSLPPVLHLATRDAPLPTEAPPHPGMEATVPDPTPLTPAEVEALLAPLPPLLHGGEGVPAEDRAPAGVDGPDRGGPGGGGTAAIGVDTSEPARVLGVFPSGEVDGAPDVTVVFSHPVVPLGAVGEATSVPFRWEPEVPGSWHWLDATTARFLPRDGRLPGGQHYRLQVDPRFGGVEGRGRSVPVPHEAHIHIRGPLAMAGSGGDRVLPTLPVLVLGFDQEVDTEVVASHASFRILGASPASRPSAVETAERVPARARSLDEAPDDDREAAMSGRHAGIVALSPATPLPPGSWVRLELAPDLTSAEGPGITGRRQDLHFRTADTFRLEGASCPTAEAACTAWGAAHLRFSNPVDPDQPLEERIRVTPEVPGLTLRADGQGRLNLFGDFRPRTTYEVEVREELNDLFGSRLGTPERVALHFDRASPTLSIRGAPFVSLAPGGSGTLELPVRALDRVAVRVFEADPARWSEWISSSPGFRPHAADRVEGLRELERRELVPEDGGEGFSFLHLPLASALEAGGGQVVVLAEGYARDRRGGLGSGSGTAHQARIRSAVAWVQAPSLRIQLVTDAERLALQTWTLEGEPAAGVRLRLPEAGVEGVSNAKGFASLPLPTEAGLVASLLVAELDGKQTLVPSSPGGGGYPRWMGTEGTPGPLWAASVDRPLYRPGEALAFHGWVQEVSTGNVRDVRAPERIKALRYEVMVPPAGGGQARTVHTGQVEVSPFGGFHGEAKLPFEMAPGSGRVHLSALVSDGSGGLRPEPGWTRDLSFRVADLRRPDYEVRIVRDPDLLLPDTPFHLTAEARYFDGPGLPGSELRWSLATSATSYIPPGWQAALPPVRESAVGGEGAGPGAAGTVAGPLERWHFGVAPRSPLAWATGGFPSPPVLHEARTDAEGRHRLEVLPSELRRPFPLTLTVSVTVQDLNRQAGSASTRAILLPGQALPGIRILPQPAGAGGRLLAGDTLHVEVVVLDAEGAPLPGDRHAPPEVRVERVVLDPEAEWNAQQWVVEASTPVSCSPGAVPTPQGSPHGARVQGLRCQGVPAEPGSWLVSVEVLDGSGQRSRGEANVTVHDPAAPLRGTFRAGGGLPGFGIPGRSGEALEVQVEGNPNPGVAGVEGDSVHLLIRSPFSGGRGMAVLNHGGVRQVQGLTLEADAWEHRVGFSLEGAPGFRSVEVLLENPEGDRGASGVASFEVAPRSRRLDLAVEAPVERVQPGSTVPVEVTVLGEGGAPEPGAEVTIWLVDEAAFFAAGGHVQRFNAEGLDPWGALYRVQDRIQTRGGLWLHLLRERRPPGEGELQARLFDGLTGSTASVTLTVTGTDGVIRTVRPDPNGEVHLTDLPPGDLQIRVVHLGQQVALEETVRREGNEAVELGTLLLRERVPPQVEGAMLHALVGATPDDLPPPGLALREVVVSGTTFEALADPPAIEVPAPPEQGTDPSDALLRSDFSPLAGMVPRVMTGEDGVARATFRLPDTLTRYRVLAVARSGEAEGPSVGSGEGIVVAGQDLVVRATPPRFLRRGDEGDISLVVENGSEADAEIEVALRASGLALEGSGGVRLQVPAGVRREVRFPARATAPGAAAVQVRARTGPASDAEALRIPVGLPAAPERMAFRALLEPGEGRTVRLEPSTPADPDWGSLEVVVTASLAGGLGAELLALSETTLPWAGLRVARVRGLAALTEAMARDPDLGAALDPAALASLRHTAEADMVALGAALRRARMAPSAVGAFGDAARFLGSWSLYTVLEASEALEEARRAGLLSEERFGNRPPAPLDPIVLQGVLHRWSAGLGRPGEGRGVPPDPTFDAFDLALLWVLHRGGTPLSTLPDFLRPGVLGLDVEGMRPLWLARVAAMLALAEEPLSLPVDAEGSREGGGPPSARARPFPPGSHRPFLEALENRARITPGGVTFRRGSPVAATGAPGTSEALSFSASSPAEDAEILLALAEAFPRHTLLPGLVATVAGSEGVGTWEGAPGDADRPRWGPEVVGRSLPALEAWARVHAGAPVESEVLVRMEGDAGEARAWDPLPVRSGEPPSHHRVSTAALPLPLTLEARNTGSSGPLASRVLLTWTAADPFQPPRARGFVVRRSYEAVDDPEDVRRDPDGTWRIRAGARVRVLHELLLPERRVDVRLEDPFPAGFEPVQGTAGDEGAGRAPGAAEAEILLDGRWGLSGGASFLLAAQGMPWYRELHLARDHAIAWAPTVPPGRYRGSWIARATLPGRYIVPGARAWEAGRPDVMGRSEAFRVVVEGR